MGDKTSIDLEKIGPVLPQKEGLDKALMKCSPFLEEGFGEPWFLEPNSARIAAYFSKWLCPQIKLPSGFTLCYLSVDEKMSPLC
jgi:hypothetical protein